MKAKLSQHIPRKISVAPMMDYTDRHFRYLCRLLSPNTWLYTEMVTTGALIHGDQASHLAHHVAEYPLALQLGGSEPKELAQCAQMAEDWGYDEINLNVGCPSDRVQKGRFGACLMKEPDLVAECIQAMQEAVTIPVSIKTRIGVDDYDSYEYLRQFVAKIMQTGCQIFTIHARKAWLKGLSPKENREIPPLHYDVVYKLKQDFPHLTILLNGGVKTSAEVLAHLQYVDGVMIGREAYQNPLLLNELDSLIHKSREPADLLSVLSDYLLYMTKEIEAGTSFWGMSKHLMGLFKGKAGARHWRRFLSEELRTLSHFKPQDLLAKAQTILDLN